MKAGLTVGGLALLCVLTAEQAVHGVGWGVRSLAISGRHVVAGGDDGTLRLWQVRSALLGQVRDQRMSTVPAVVVQPGTVQPVHLLRVQVAQRAALLAQEELLTEVEEESESGTDRSESEAQKVILS